MLLSNTRKDQLVRTYTMYIRMSIPIHSPTCTHIYIHPDIERISPPSSDIGCEGTAVIGLALDKYTKRKTSKDFTDSQLIRNEVLQQMNPTMGGASSNSSISSTSSVDCELPVGSYGAMLRSYARRSTASKLQKEIAPVVAQRQVQHRQSVIDSSPQSEGEEGRGEGGREEGEGEGVDLHLALSLNYEVCLTVACKLVGPLVTIVTVCMVLCSQGPTQLFVVCSTASQQQLGGILKVR